jgi:hypothetical protein
LVRKLCERQIEDPRQLTFNQARELMQARKEFSSEEVIVFGFLSAVALWTYVFLPFVYLPSKEGHTMSAGNWTDGVTAIGAIVAAGAAVYTAYLAKQASDTWRKGLEYQRIDEAISAVHEVRSKFDRVISLMEARADIWKAYDDTWVSWTHFDQAYAVAPRYYSSLLNPIHNTLSDFLFELEDHCRSDYDPAHGGISPDHRDALYELKEKMGNLAERAETTLRAT